MRVFQGLEAARAAVLSRPPMEERDLPEHVAQRMVEVFGEPLTAAQAVQRIIAWPPTVFAGSTSGPSRAPGSISRPASASWCGRSTEWASMCRAAGRRTPPRC